MSDTVDVCEDCNQPGSDDNRLISFGTSGDKFFHEQGQTGCMKALARSLSEKVTELKTKQEEILNKMAEVESLSLKATSEGLDMTDDGQV